MKRIVWENKSNGQLCITVPKNSGIKEGEIVSISKDKISSIVYSVVTGDLFHYGHLRVLQAANKEGEFHICGVLTDDAVEKYKDKPVARYKEREAIISSLRCVDMVMKQTDLDPTQNLQELTQKFPYATITLVFGSNWTEIPGKAYIEQIGGRIVQPPYYDKLSRQKIVGRIKERKGNEK